MSHKYDVYFHLGFPKVASTFLQKEVFPNLSNIEFHKKHRFNYYKKLNPEKLENHHLFSSEKDHNLEVAVYDIVEKFPQAKIIVLFRRQDKWILSRYKYYIRKHGWKSFEEFFDLESNNGLWNKKHLFYKKKIRNILDIAHEPPLFLTMDLLRDKPDIFFNKIEQYTNSKLEEKANTKNVINKSFNNKQLILLRKFNRFYNYRKLSTPYSLVNSIHYRISQYTLHIMAFLFRFAPSAFVNEKKLVDPQKLKKIKEYYEEDWTYTLNYVNQQL